MKIAIALLSFAMLGGCISPTTPPPPRVNPAPTVEGQQAKDATITTSADAIDSIVAPTPQAPAVKVETDAIRAAVVANPAADVAALVAQFEAVIKRLDADLAEERKRRVAAENAALKEQARWLTWTGVGLFAAFGLSLFAGGGLMGAVKTWPLLLLGAGCFGLAQLISHPWFLRGFAGLLVAGVGYAVYWVYDRHQQGRLREALAKRERLLKQVVPVLDYAYENAHQSIKDVLDRDVFNKLGSLFSAEQKAEIHHLRGEVKAPAN
jgi:hypothetical protein